MIVTICHLPKLAAPLMSVLLWLALPCEESVAQFGRLFGGPKVETIETREVHSLMVDHQKRRESARQQEQPEPQAEFIVVDVRSPREFKVSVIPGAITKTQYEQNAAKYRGRLVIPYCTVGARSGSYAKQLAKRGVNTKNYEASILGWVGEGLPLVTLDGRPTKRVHTYSDDYHVPNGYEQVTE